MNLCGVFFNEPEGNNTYNTGFCLFWCTRGTPELKPRAVALELTSRSWGLKELMPLVSSPPRWPSSSAHGVTEVPQAKGSHLALLRPPTCTVALQVVTRELNGKDAGLKRAEVYLLRGLRWGGSLGPSGRLFFPTGTQLMGVLDTHCSHLPHDSTCCSRTVPLWIERQVGPLRCTCCGLYWLMPSKRSCRKTFPKLLPKPSQSW